MPKKSRTLKMCIVNPKAIDGLSQLVGTQTEIMTRVGISWNTWIKIRAVEPIRVSVGKRLQDRIIANGDFCSFLKGKAIAEGHSKSDQCCVKRNFLLNDIRAGEALTEWKVNSGCWARQRSGRSE